MELEEDEHIVAPFAGAWIEIGAVVCVGNVEVRSHPSRVRGLKFVFNHSTYHSAVVAPFAGAWIEMCDSANICFFHSVAPFAGAWIEI